MGERMDDSATDEARKTDDLSLFLDRVASNNVGSQHALLIVVLRSLPGGPLGGKETPGFGLSRPAGCCWSSEYLGAGSGRNFATHFRPHILLATSNLLACLLPLIAAAYSPYAARSSYFPASQTSPPLSSPASLWFPPSAYTLPPHHSTLHSTPCDHR